MAESPLFLYTRSKQKTKHIGNPFNIYQPRFNEEEIKSRIDRNQLPHPFLYPLVISREKFYQTLNNLPKKEDIIPVVSDVVLAVEGEGDRWIILNRDGESNEDKQKAKKQAEQNGYIYLLGAATFGTTKNGEPYSALSFLKIFLRARRIPSIPLNIDKIPQIADYFLVGYIDPNFNEKVVAQTTNFDNPNGLRARPYISGLTEEVLETAEVLGNLEREITPIIRELKSQYSVGSSNYNAPSNEYDPRLLEELHTRLSNTNFLKKRGGNCSFIYLPNENQDKENGHAGILITTDNELSVVVDPSLPMSSLLPYSNRIPLHYEVNYGLGKTASVTVNDQGNLTLIVNSPNKERTEYPIILLE